MLRIKKLITINISIGTYQDFIRMIIELAENQTSSYICCANVHMLVEAYDDKEFRKIINFADIVTPDGLPLIVALRLLYGIKQERIPGPDLMLNLLKEAEKNNLSVYFYGSTEYVLNIIKKKIETIYPNLKIAGMYSPPFRELTKKEEEYIINLINKSNPNITFVSLGCPKQERWMYKVKGKINSVMMGVGAAFDFFAGTKKRAPIWMQNIGLEWFYRLTQEPKRLFKRYAYTNTKFLYLLSKEFCKLKLLKKGK